MRAEAAARTCGRSAGSVPRTLAHWTTAPAAEGGALPRAAGGEGPGARRGAHSPGCSALTPHPRAWGLLQLLRLHPVWTGARTHTGPSAAEGPRSRKAQDQDVETRVGLGPRGQRAQEPGATAAFTSVSTGGLSLPFLSREDEKLGDPRLGEVVPGQAPRGADLRTPRTSTEAARGSRPARSGP